MTRVLGRLFNFEQGESKPFWILLLGGILLMMGIVSLDASALSYYFLLKQQTNTTHLILASAGLSLVAIQIQLSIQNRLPFYQSLLLLLAAIGGALFWFKINSEDLLWQKMIFICAGPITLLSSQLFWNLSSRLFDPIQFRKFSIRLELIAILGSLCIFLLHRQFHMSGESMLLLGFYSYLACFLVWAYSLLDFERIIEYNTDLLNIRFYNNFISLAKDEYKRWLLLYSIITGILLGAIELFFLLVVSQQSENASEYLSFYIGFIAITSLVGNIAGMSLHRLINDRYGYRVTMLIEPVMAIIVGGIFAGFALNKNFEQATNSNYLLFMLIVIVAGGIQVITKAFEIHTFRYYTLPLEQSLRSDIQTKLEAFYRPIGKIVLFSTIAFFAWEFNLSYSYWALSIPLFALLTGVVVYFMHAAYRIQLKKNLGDEAVKDKTGGNQKYYSDELKERIPHLPQSRLSRHLSLLQILDYLKFQQSIKEIANHEDNAIQRIAIKEISSRYQTEVISILERIQKSKYYAISPNKELIQRTMNKLKGAELRKKKVKYLEQLTISKINKERSLGALLCTQSSDDIKGRLLGKLFLDVESDVRKDAVIASAGTLNNELIQLLIEKLADPRFSNDAVASLAKSGEEILSTLESAFHLTGQEEKVQLKIVQIYGRIGTESAANLLLKKLNHNNQNIGAAALEALGHCDLKLTKEHELRFREQLEQVCEVIIWNMSAILDLKNSNAKELILNAMEAEIKENYDLLFKLLSLISDASSIYLVKKNINSGDPEKADFAAELLDVLVAEELKPMLIPIVTVGSYEEKISSMKDFFPTTPLSKHDVLFNLVQRDYKWVNRWTKACAMIELAAERNPFDEELFAANLINPDMLLRETAALSLLKLEPALLDHYLERFRPEYNINRGNEIINKILLKEIKEKGTSPALKFEIIQMLRSIPELEEIPGIILLEISRVMELEEYQKGAIVDEFESCQHLNYYLVASGTLELKTPEMTPIEFTKGMFIHPMDFFQTHHSVLLSASENSLVYKIKKEKFFELIAEHEEIPQSLLSEKAFKRKIEFTELQRTPELELAE